MISKVLSYVREMDMIKTGDRITVGLSGGADSVALLCVLKRLEPGLGITLSACHVNHRLRGGESDSDERFCQRLCRQMEVPFAAVSADVGQFCRQNGLSTEDGARRLRYEALLSFDRGAKVATAHTLSDNAETVLLNLARGAALDGLCGIPPVRGSIIRPLLCCTRREVEEFLEGIGQRFVTDSTNLSDGYRRNRLRHHVIPVLKDFNGSLEETIGRSSQALREDKEFLDRLARELADAAALPAGFPPPRGLERLESVWPVEKRFDAGLILRAGKPVRMRFLRMLLEGFGLGYDAGRLNALDSILSNGGAVQPAGQVRFSCRGGCLSAVKSFGPLRFDEARLAASPEGDECFGLGGGFGLRLRPLTPQEIKFFVNNRPLQFKNAIDCDRIDNIITLRKRKPGDSFEPAGRGCTQSFKNLLNSAGLPLSARDSLAVLSDGRGVIWLEGFGTAQRAALTSNTRRAVLPDISEV